MDKYLTQTFYIKSHPIRSVADRFKTQYILGLGEFLCYITQNDYKTKLVYEIWSYSITDRIISDSWRYTENFDSVKNALCFKRDGLTFFTMRQSFLFDCLYMLEKSKKELLPNAYTFLIDKICGFLTRGTLNITFDYFQGKNIGDKIPDVLKCHRKLDLDFQKKKLKRILIVSTMSSGKSTLINAITGYRLNRMKSTACTNKLCYIFNKPNEDGLAIGIGENKVGYITDKNSINSDQFDFAALKFNSYLSNEHICFIDTPGVNNSNDSTHGDVTKSAISKNDYEILLFISNSQYFDINDENEILDYTINHTKRPIIFVLNQLDSFSPEDDSIEETMTTFDKILRSKNIHPTIIPISAKVAMLSKFSKNQMTKIEKIEYNNYKERFQDRYYDLASYYDPKRSSNKNDFFSMSGVNILEKMLKDL